MIKDFIGSLTDADTGEILYTTNTKNGKMPFGDGMRVPVCIDNKSDFSLVRKFFDCFCRGVSSGRNLSVTLTIRDYKPAPTLLDIF